MIADRDTSQGISGWEINLRLMEQAELIVKSIEFLKSESVICSHFGCGHVLTLQQQLFGNKCPAHSGVETSTILTPLPCDNGC